MIPEINNWNILRVKHCFDAFRSVHSNKMQVTAPVLDQLNENERWLLSLICFLIESKFLRATEESRYFPVPYAAEQKATFKDFLTLVRQYRRKRIRAKNEAHLLGFLKDCTSEFRDFYLSILTREAWLQLFMKLARDYIDPRQIHSDDIFGGERSFIRSSFQQLKYPLLVTTIPRPDLPSALVYRSKGRNLRVCRFEGKKKVTLRKWLKLDEKFILTPAFALAGLIDEERGEFYPLDFFDTIEQYRAHMRRGRAVPPYYLRLRSLEDFLKHNFLRQIQKLPKEHVHSDREIEEAVRRVLVGSPHVTLLFKDEARATHVLEAVDVKGIIGGIWEENGVARGFTVWHNTFPVNCTYDFTGVNNALLFRPEILAGRVVRMWLFVFDRCRTGAVKEILFDEKPFCDFELIFQNGMTGRIEKCAYCAKDGTEVAYKYKGICYTTNCNWQSLMGLYGPDVWIKPRKQLADRRKATAWEPFILNNIGFTYKGYKLVAREEDGALMFKSDAETMRKYQYLISEDSTWTRGIKDILKFTTAEDLMQRYQERRGKGEVNEADPAALSNTPEENQGGPQLHLEPERLSEHAPPHTEPGEGGI